MEVKFNVSVKQCLKAVAAKNTFISHFMLMSWRSTFSQMTTIFIYSIKKSILIIARVCVCMWDIFNMQKKIKD